MQTGRFALDPGAPPRLTHGEHERLDGMTDEDITAAAYRDPDNPPLTDEEIERFAFARAVKVVRSGLGLSQAEFTRRFHIPSDTLLSWEEGRSAPDALARAYLRVIEREPDAVTRALGDATDALGDRADALDAA